MQRRSKVARVFDLVKTHKKYVWSGLVRVSSLLVLVWIFAVNLRLAYVAPTIPKDVEWAQYVEEAHVEEYKEYRAAVRNRMIRQGIVIELVALPIMWFLGFVMEFKRGEYVTPFRYYEYCKTGEKADQRD